MNLEIQKLVSCPLFSTPVRPSTIVSRCLVARNFAKEFLHQVKLVFGERCDAMPVLSSKLSQHPLLRLRLFTEMVPRGAIDPIAPRLRSCSPRDMQADLVGYREEDCSWREVSFSIEQLEVGRVDAPISLVRAALKSLDAKTLVLVLDLREPKQAQVALAASM